MAGMITGIYLDTQYEKKNVCFFFNTITACKHVPVKTQTTWTRKWCMSFKTKKCSKANLHIGQAGNRMLFSCYFCSFHAGLLQNPQFTNTHPCPTRHLTQWIQRHIKVSNHRQQHPCKGHVSFIILIIEHHHFQWFRAAAKHHNPPNHIPAHGRIHGNRDVGQPSDDASLGFSVRRCRVTSQA